MRPLIHLTRRRSPHPAALSLAEMKLDLRKDFLTMLGPGFRWVRAFGMTKGQLLKLSRRSGGGNVSAFVPGRKESSHVG